MEQNPKNPKKKKMGIVLAVLAVIAVLILAFSFTSLVETVGADEIVVIQDPVDGDLHVYLTPGLKWQNWGKVEVYKKESQYSFSAFEDEGESRDQSLKIRFNDGGNAKISGTCQWAMPLNEKDMTALHSLYGSQIAVEQKLVRPVITKSVYNTGPLMSSKESYADKRPQIIQYIEDQANTGVFKTKSVEVKGVDPLSGKPKTFTRIQLVLDENGAIARQEVSPIGKYSINIYNLAVNRIVYDKTVEDQIKSQQQAMMDVQTSTAKAKKAEQEAIKAEKEGQARAAEAKWKQEEINAKEIALAEKDLKVAQLSKQTAGELKQKLILEGQGEAEKKRLVMQADGALKQKLASYEKVSGYWANAYKDRKVPTYVNYGGGDASGSTDIESKQFQQLVNLLLMENIGLDMKMKK